MRHSRLAAVLVTGLLFAAAAHADPSVDQVRKTVKAVTHQDVVKLEKSKVPGLYEVHTKTQLFYTDAKGEYVLFGAHVFSTADNSDYTEKRMSEIVGYKFSDLPLKDAIKIVTGNGKRTVVSIEDPNCPYCKRFTKTVADAGNVTQYVFVVSILGEDSKKKAKNILCAADPSKAWLDWMLNGKPAPEVADCANALKRNLQLMTRYRVNGTPALFFKNGERAPGALPLDELEKRLARQPD